MATRGAREEGREPVEAAAGEAGRAKVAILLSGAPSLARVEQALDLAELLSGVELVDGRRLDLCLGLPEADEPRWRALDARARARVPGLVVRHLQWTPVARGNAERMFDGLGDAHDLEGINHLVAPRDWGWNFSDCELWIDLADAGLGALLPLRTTLHLVEELPERYVPAIAAAHAHDAYWLRQVDGFRMWRQGQVATFDPATVPDLVSYAGVRPERIQLLPHPADCRPAAPIARRGGEAALLWLLRGDAGDGYADALAGWQIYAREGGKLALTVAWPGNAGGPGAHPGLAGRPQDLVALDAELGHVHYRSLAERDRLIGSAAALWSSDMAGRGDEALRLARRVGRPLLTAAVGDRAARLAAAGIAAQCYDPSDPLALADALHGLERALADETLAGEAKDGPVDREEAELAWAAALDQMVAYARAG